MSRLRITAATLEATGSVFAVGCVLVVTLWALHPSLLLANTLTAGGDTGAHVALPWFLRTQLLGHGQLTGWYPGWFDGFPVYTYYFVLADLVAAVASYVLPYAVAFKLATILGSLLLPICGYALGKLFALRAPIPACLAAATLPFLFEPSFRILGGNLFSTLAGEYGFSLSLALALVAMGLFARGMRTGRGVVLAAVALTATLAAHLLPWLWAIGGIVVLFAIELIPGRFALRDVAPGEPPRGLRRAAWFTARAGALSLALSAWWLLPFATSQGFTSSLGYVNDGSPPVTPSFPHELFPVSDRLMLLVAVGALAVAWARRSRFGIWLTSLSALSAVAYVADPQGSLWDERLLPFWFFGTWLACGWLAGVALSVGVQRLRQRSAERWIADLHHRRLRPRPRGLVVSGWSAALLGPVAAGLLAMVIVLPPMTSVVPRSVLADFGITPGANEVPVWAAYNYTGYQGVRGWGYQKDWPEYHAIVQMLKTAGATHGCGQAMWQYDPSEGDFGTTESLMLLPYWTNNCIGSMEGLLFESSSTTPYHFLDQSELSLRPSDAMNGLPYTPAGSPDVVLGLEHLQQLGVRYFFCYSPRIVRATEASGLATLLARTRTFRFGAHVRTWSLFEVHDAPLVRPLQALPNVVASLGASHAWLEANVHWWVDPKRWPVLLASTGPASWPHAASPSSVRKVPVSGAVRVSDVKEGIASISFHVSRIGVPVEVSVSYYPNWQAAGATGPYRVSPNLMVVVPTSREVVLTYGTTPAQEAGDGLTLAGLAVVAGALALSARRRLRRRAA